MHKRRRRFILSVSLFLLEALFFVLLCKLLHIGFNETMTFVCIYTFIQFFNKRYSFSPVLIWQEITELFKSHLLFYGISLCICILLEHKLLLEITLMTCVMFCIDILLSRILRKIFLKQCATQILVIGAGKDAESFKKVITNNGFMFVNIVNYVDLEPITHEKCTDEAILEKRVSIKDLNKVIEENYIDEVFIVDESLDNEQFNTIMNMLHSKVQVIKYKPKISLLQPYNTDIEDFDGNLFVSIKNAKTHYLDVIIKRLIDLSAGLIGCCVLLPLAMIVKIISLLSGDKDPIFFNQERIGKNGNIIKIYKFRSMVPNAEQILEELMENDPKIKEEYLTNKKLEHDPRITKIGNVLRKTSLDEIPQFINVLKGEMSLIGPRPYLPREITDMGSYYETIIKSKPGITGMWQANGRSSVGFEDRCRLDEYYYNNWSIWLDLIIVVKTVKAVLKKEGAV